ncbi:amidophosphoribosyltransferase [Aminithiophilus ramosus]|uniref:Amidophosphoribosyltransferase n=2 Tax=Synergistales TaxID=649776 RepID=A0A9Q7AP37_9BACT|nr:amidophosphoribosyltransferase [Aminithiophilus ramosus]QTX32962.1 amidophosphoribosyltransferase [Aminithiophilus ramosus]QVL37273.1 amidophosphoribosyltransferase [Synergistota bacterium]
MCGVFGAYSPRPEPLLEDVYLGLYALQHRGQESAGVAWINGDGMAKTVKGMGLVHDALNQHELSQQETRVAIGHVRYSTAGGSLAANAQPLVATYARGPVGIAHNGNLTNGKAIAQYLESRGAIFQSTTDTEVIIHLMAHQAHKPPLEALIGALRRLVGAYSLAVLLEDRLVAARDPWGFRPLVLGKRGDVTYIASESCALDIVGAELIRDVEPGEIVVVDEKGIRSLRIPVEPKRHFGCAFEYVYFARPDSIIDGRSVYAVRKELGRLLAKGSPCPGANLVTGMPDSGTLAAMGYAEESSIAYEKAIVRNRYVGRTFIQPTQRVRDLGVRIKLNPVPHLMEGKDVVVVDDSIVRGTTAQRIVTLMRGCGARNVHLRIASPPVRFPCYYGIDTPVSEELAAARMDIEGLERQVGACSLAYLREEDLFEAIGRGRNDVCTACFSGHYLEGKEIDHDLDL